MPPASLTVLCAVTVLHAVLHLVQGADPNLPNHDGWHALDLACELNKLGKVEVKPECVPVHALLVGWGAKNSSAFKQQVSAVGGRRLGVMLAAQRAVDCAGCFCLHLPSTGKDS